jgi:hypothetical protein
MVATEYDLTVVELENEKPEFNVVSFSALIERINTHPELLSNDWRELVKSEFRLSFEQEQSLVRVSGERVQEIQSSLAYFGQEINRGAIINGRIIKRPIEEQTPDAVHGIQLELRLPDPSTQTFSVVKMLRIAHCDANCRNWQWDSW